MPIPDEALIKDANGNPIFVSLSRLQRDENLKTPPKFKVGDIVVLTITKEVVGVRRDCDGSPLYDLFDAIYGISEDQLREATEEEADNW